MYALTKTTTAPTPVARRILTKWLVMLSVEMVLSVELLTLLPLCAGMLRNKLINANNCKTKPCNANPCGNLLENFKICTKSSKTVPP